MGLLGALLMFLIGSVSSRSVVDVNNDNLSSIQKFLQIIAPGGLNSAGLKGSAFKKEIEDLMTNHPNVVETIVEGGSLNNLLNKVPPSWILVFPGESLISSWIEDSPSVLAQYLRTLPKTDPIATKIVSSFTTHEDKQITFLDGISDDSQLSNSIWSKISEVISREWWSKKNDSIIVEDLVKESKNALKFLPYDIVNGANVSNGFDIFSSNDDWSQVPRAHICIWKNVIEKSTLILRNVFDLLKLRTDGEFDGFVPLLQCFSPKDLSNWKSESNRVSNNKTPILKMIKNSDQFKLNPLQVQALADCIDWSDTSLKARKDVFHMLDPSLIGQEDLKDYDEKYFGAFKISWELIIRVNKLKFSQTMNQSISNLLLKEMGPIYVTRSREVFNPETESLTLDAVNRAYSPWMRLSQARNILKHMDNGIAINSDLAYALPSTTILEWGDTNIERLRNTNKMTPTQKWAMAENLLSNTEFIPYYSDILEWIHPKSNLTFLKGTEDIPHSLKYEMFDEEWKQLRIPMSKDDIHDKLDSLVPSITCAKLYNSSLLDLPLIASSFNNYIKSSSSKHLLKFAPSLRHCFKDQMVKYFEQKALFYGLSDAWSAFSMNDVKIFGGYIFSAMKLEDIQKIDNYEIKKSIIQELGTVPMSELMPVLSYSDLKELAIMGVEEEEASFSTINKLGSLSYFLDESFLQSLHPFDIRLFIKTTLSGDSRKKLTCLNKKDRDTWSNIIIHGYAAPRSWRAWDLIHFGDLLINVQNNSLMDIRSHNFRKAMMQILESSQLLHTYTFFPKFERPTTFLEACESWLDEDIERDSFRNDFNTLMRFYLKVSEYSIIVAKRDTVEELPPKNLRSRRALKEKLFELYNRMNHVWTALDSTSDTNREYLKKLVIQITNEKERLLRSIIQVDDKEPKIISDLYKEYRSSPTKISEHLDSIEDFLIDAQRFVIREVKYLYNLTAKEITPEYDEKTFCSIVGCVDQDWCSLQECFTMELTHKPLNITCDGIIAARMSAVSLESNDISKWTSKDKLDCLSVLGNVPWISKEKKSSIWNAIKDSVDLKNTEQLLSLGTLLEVIDLEDIEFRDTNIDAISFIGSFSGKPVDLVATSRIKKYLKDAENSKEILELRKVGLGHLLCSLNEDGDHKEMIEMLFGPLYGKDQSPISNGKNQSRIFDFNRLTILEHLYSCDNKNFRTEVMNQVMKYYGDSVEKMSASDVSSLGLFISGMDPELLKMLPIGNFEFIPPWGVKYLTPDQLSLISVNKLSRMTPESLSVFKESHVPKSFPIDSRQINLLRRNKMELPEAQFALESDLALDPGVANVLSKAQSIYNRGGTIPFYSFTYLITRFLCL
ncbi:uncharacterized protein [Lepeophtheirus salmonis]|uniref:uncharacterized protein n=1 Tax=Lepeophtheirus salmonis TaxID=72036 RepID=UPI001AEB5A1B|nr:uncharacterized protein LOC121119692 [Lepeophtheirus salmonis]